MNNLDIEINNLKEVFEGEIFVDDAMLTIYSTDASAYRERPTAVCYPKNNQDIKHLIQFANNYKIPIIPRTAGTSLAGQVVGSGIIADVSKHMNQIIEVNKEEHWVRVQPGVILDELNLMMKEYGLFFGPETSTANRCMMGGMLGNNACGAHSLVYGSTRDHTLEVEAILSDGSEVLFKSLNKKDFQDKLKLENLEGNLYRNISNILGNEENKKEIIEQFPLPELERRNTGYALDLLLRNNTFGSEKEDFNFCSLLAGSEGTLAFSTSIKLNLVPFPPKDKALVCVHLDDIPQSLRANLIALKYQPASIELMDKAIMDLTKENRNQEQNRFFVEGDPGAILIVEFAEESMAKIEQKAQDMEKEMRNNNYGFHFPIVKGGDIKKVWNLRKAGLGLLSNMPGDAKPAPVIEDTAVSPELLPDYISDFDALLKQYSLECVYYAHIATGELHLRPILNLKDPKDVELFHTIALETAKLVKKYKGSLSGEHGDGRLRGEFIPMMIGDHNYQLLKDLKNAWDPNNIFNPGKITDTPKMNTSLRWNVGEPTKEIDTIFDYSSTGGFIRAVEKCNGSGDCRKTELIGGTMCPSYMASRDEKNATRARANMLREYITKSTKKNPFDHPEIYESLDLCLSCKACKSECPSNIDMTKFKAEFMQHWYDEHGVPIRSLFVAYIHKISSLGMIWPAMFNWVVSNKAISSLMKKSIGFAPKRSIPTLYKTTLKAWVKNNKFSNKELNKKVYLFADEFTNYNDVRIGIKAVELLNRLGYEVVVPKHKASGRTYLSKGLLRKAKAIAIENVNLLSDIINIDTPLIGIEPSAILSFRDEYPDIVGDKLKESAINLGKNTLLFDEFFNREIAAGRIEVTQFHDAQAKVKLHGHCQQKAVASTDPTKEMLSFPKNYSAEEIPSGCCGMAGSFGYEKEHYDLSMKIGELVLFPAVRKMEIEEILVAPGTSCRHQIKDGTGADAKHPIEIMLDALN